MTTINQGDDWFRLFQEGNENAFRQVFEKYYRPVTYFAQKIIKDDTYSEDIASEAFRKAWDRRDKFATPRHLENFLYLVTRNDCISQLRSNRVVQAAIKELVLIANNDESPDSAVDLERVQTRVLEIIFKKMGAMPGGEVLRMAYLEGLSTKEIAEKLKTTENNVYIIKSRSLKVLRKLLTKTEWMFFILLFLHP